MAHHRMTAAPHCHTFKARLRLAIKGIKSSYLELILAGLLELFVSLLIDEYGVNILKGLSTPTAMCCSLVYHMVSRE